MFRKTTAARFGAAAVLAGGAVVLGAGSASAHVTVTPSETASGAYTVLTFAWGHGCDGSPTTEVAVSIPDGIYSVSPARNPYYTIEKKMETLDEPVDDGHGGEYTERVSEVVYTAETPLPDGQRDSFELSLKLPEGDEGTAMAFPVVQTCEEGETAWIEEVVEGEEEPATPAPTFVLTAASGDGHGGHSHGDEAKDDADEASASPDSDSSALGWTGLGLGALGAVLGGTALARGNKKTA